MTSGAGGRAQPSPAPPPPSHAPQVRVRVRAGARERASEQQRAQLERGRPRTTNGRREKIDGNTTRSVVMKTHTVSRHELVMRKQKREERGEELEEERRGGTRREGGEEEAPSARTLKGKNVDGCQRYLRKHDKHPQTELDRGPRASLRKKR